ncbi:MAG: DEAD/DEAH box helicase family protein [Armatimonadetes bacterium]|nr:DEAD/DEAH box helicase family protein [Armatimonadota bacterium]
MDAARKIELFLSAFRGRDDVHALRWESTDGTRSGYKPVHRPLDAEAAFEHLRGRKVLGIYPLLDSNKTWFLAMDFDGPSAWTEATAVVQACAGWKMPCYLERSRSGQGAHIWIFFEEPMDAALAREMGKILAHSTDRPLRGFDRFFPSQDRHTGKGLGNLIALPLQGQSHKNGHTLFVDPATELPFPDQWAVLEHLHRVPSREIDRVLREGCRATLAPLPLATADPVQPVDITRTSPVEILVREHLEIPYASCPPSAESFLREALVFQNPGWLEKRSQGHWIDDTPRFIRCCGRIGDNFLAPRGVRHKLLGFLEDQKLPYAVKDLRPAVESSPIGCRIKLRPDQCRLVDEILKHDEAVLEAPTGAGKTVIALAVLAARGVPTMIGVYGKTLLEQWRDAVLRWLEIEPSEIGIIGSSVSQPGRRITIATMQTLARKDLSPITPTVGQVIMDECHHIPANTFATVIRQFPARYLLGLTATPSRRDQLGRVIFFYLGKHIKGPTAIQLDRQGQILLPTLRVRDTTFETASLGFAALVEAMVRDDPRNQQIVDDVIAAVEEGHCCLVLSHRQEHCDRLADRLSQSVGVATLYGRTGKKAKAATLRAVPEGRAQVLVSTVSLLGEGFDCPAFSMLCLATPMSGKSSRLKQVVGRVVRLGADKPAPLLYDYRDPRVGMAEGMWRSRLKLYQSYLGDERLPVEFRKGARKGGRATVEGPRRVPRRGVPEGQLRLEF